MKKVLVLCMVVCLTMTMFVGCGVKEQIAQVTDEMLNLPEFFEKRVEGTEIDYDLPNGLVASDIGNDKILFTNNPKGYQLELPKDVSFNTELNYLQTKVINSDFDLRITREWSPYEDIDWYIDTYLTNYIKDSYWRSENNVKFSKGKMWENKYKYIVDSESIRLDDMQANQYDGYTYAIIKGEGRIFFFFMFKYNAKDKQTEEYNIEKVYEILDTFSAFAVNGEAINKTDYKPVIPENWSEETKSVYDSIVNGNNLKWGVFCKDIYNTGINETVPDLENKLEYKFPVILSYFHFNQEFPLEFLRKNYSEGKLVELTYQMTTSNNEKLNGYTPNLDIYRGLRDEDIRTLAKGFKDFGHPVLFRINNEMNSDWTSYGGVINMIDPEIFIENWKRMYHIFEEEGVNNVIWIFNPNDRNHPPCDWNSALTYYPGNEYVQMIGVTGYNNGTYYAEEHGETWREFEEIYDKFQEEYGEIYGEFPWIITEFSSSSIGGDKAKWITSMFDCIDKYENIKIAVWFNFADYDFREDRKNQVSRPYWLDETPETTEAFKEGLKKTQK